MTKLVKSILPDVVHNGTGDKKTERQIQLFTLPNIAAIVRFMGWRARFDMMNYRPVLVGEHLTASNETQDAAVHAIEDNCRRLGISPGNMLKKTLGVIGMQDQFHPMEDWVLGAQWDGVDRIDALVETVPTDSDIWPVYLRRWLVQVIEAVTGWRDTGERSLPSCLVFAGGQGIGKTQWFKKLAPGFVRTEAELHLSKNDAKDHKLDVLRFPIVELSEIDATFGASNISTLKTFLSSGRDVVRAPFRPDPIERVRSSVFGGTVNDANFLQDPSGTRRFWPVYVKGDINWRHSIDMQQLFAQAYELWASGEPYILSPEEDAVRAANSRDFRSVSQAVEAVEGFWSDHREEFHAYGFLNISQICRVTGASQHPGATAGVRAWLNENLGPCRKHGRKDRSWAFPLGANFANETLSASLMDRTDAERMVKWRE